MWVVALTQAIRVMREQPSGGHIFNMDGAGADGNATPRFAAYGATKRGLVQLSRSLQVSSPGYSGTLCFFAIGGLRRGWLLPGRAEDAQYQQCGRPQPVPRNGHNRPAHGRCAKSFVQPSS